MTPPDSAPPNPDWTYQVADRIESVVTAVRDRTTVPVTKLARFLVFGLVAGVAALVAGILLLIAAMRLHVYLPLHPVGRQVWVEYAILSAIFLLLGAFAWRKRTPQRP